VILFTTVDDDYSTCRFAYDEACLKIIKSAPVHRWDRDTKTWTTETAWVELLAKRFTDAGFTVAVDGELWTPPDPKALAPPIQSLFDALPTRLRPLVFKALAKILHPDAGGDLELMKQLNKVNEKTRR
jgi:hypothetical protein